MKRDSRNADSRFGFSPAARRFYSSLALALGTVFNVPANPQGMTVSSGTATAVQNGAQLNVTASANAFLNWQSFNIGAGETTTFVQPNASSIVWNRINDPNPSQIFGHLNANGVVVLMNSSGFYFGPDSVVKTAGFVATTATPIADPGSGGTWEFNGPPPAASIINYGQIETKSGGQLFLIAEKVENHGVLSAPDGTLGLYAGKEVLISERPDGRGLSASVTLPEGSVNNSGKLAADAGTIWMQAQTVNQDGIVQANSVQQKNGVIELLASDAVNLGNNSVITANGDDSAVSAGGQVTIKSDNSYSDAAGSRISVAGGTLGGNGGTVEISAIAMPEILSTVDGHAASGSVGGQLLLDPLNIVIGNTGNGSTSGGTVGVGTSPGTTLNLNVNSAFVGFSQIDLQAQNNITLSANVNWNLANTTGISTPGSLLKLEAGNNITLSSGSSIVGDAGWSVTMQAGRNFGMANTVNSGMGNISFGGTANLQTQDGAINLIAGNNVTVGTGFIRTMGGGNISVQALAGSVNTGTKAKGYVFNSDGYSVDSDLGGISTGAGGDVKISAGLDIVSQLPTGSSVSDAGCGAFGPQSGDVTLIAGRDVTGHYVVANGTGTINAGRNAGLNDNTQLALSLISGGWTVNAVQNIILQEVRNPNGIFNKFGGTTSSTRHGFDYSQNAYVNLIGGNSVQLRGAVIPRNAGETIPIIYAPTLNILAGIGGVTVANDVTLFPSPAGNLTVGTSGKLDGTKPGDFTEIIVSDSSASQYKALENTFNANDHATTPIHLNDLDPVTLNVGGDMNKFFLVSPKQTEITVGGDVNNCQFSIQNLHPTDVSFLNVAGDIFNRIQYTSVPLATAPDFSKFLQAADSTVRNLPNQFYYDPITHTLTFQKRMTDSQRELLTGVDIQLIDPKTALPQVDANLNPVFTHVVVLDNATADALYALSADVPQSSDTGYLINGPGTFNLNAHNLDLGSTPGILSVGPTANHALVRYGSSGAAINIQLTGDLDMFSSTISSIAGGDISIYADGNLNLGSSTIPSPDQLARGVFTTAKSDVTVIAAGDINVAGSRVAAYDGGNVFVKSLHGNVNAGAGGRGVPVVQLTVILPVFDPETHQINDYEVKSYSTAIPGSGILATTFPKVADYKSQNIVGNILVNTPEGDIVANSGGVLQLSYNGINSTLPSVTLLGGSRDDVGNILHDGSIDASGSGVIGANVVLDATAGVKGVVIAQNNLNVNANQNVNVTAVAAGDVSVNAGGAISGTIVGAGSINASGGSIDAALLSQNVSASGNVSSSQIGFAQANVAGNASQSASASDDTPKSVATIVDEDDDKKFKKDSVTITKVGRVVVILPKKT